MAIFAVFLILGVVVIIYMNKRDEDVKKADDLGVIYLYDEKKEEKQREQQNNFEASFRVSKNKAYEKYEVNPNLIVCLGNQFLSTEFQRGISIYQYDNIKFSEPIKELADYLDVTVANVKNYGTGYIDVDVIAKIKEELPHLSNLDRKTRIDGSMRIEIYDETNQKLLATGYYSAPTKDGNNFSGVGLNHIDNTKTVTMKLIDGVGWNHEMNLNIKIIDPNLWLLEI